MYDKNRIEDSLEFVRQMKEFYDSDDALDEFDPLEDQDSDELFVNLAYHMEPEIPHKEDAVQRSHAMGDSFAVPDTSVMQEQKRLAEERLRLEQEEARRRQAEQEQQKRLVEERLRLAQEEARRRQAEQEQQKRLAEERLRLAQEEARRRQAEQEQRKRLAEERFRLEQEEAKRREAELAEKKRLEEERRRLEEETKRRRQAELQEKQKQEEERRKIEEERKKLVEEQRRQEEARRQLEEERRLAQEEAKRREAELVEKRRLAVEQQRLVQEEAKRKEAELAEKKRLDEERRRLEEEEKRRRQVEVELQEKLKQEEERRKIEEERRKLAEEQKRQEQVRRQLEEERQRLVEEQLQRELEEQRKLLAEQARRAQEEKARKEAEEKERRRKLVLEEEKRKQELQAREEERRRQAEEEKKQQDQAAAQKQNTDMPDPAITAPAGGNASDSEIERLRKRAEELKRQAEMATLEARMRQLQLESEGISTGEGVMPQQTGNTGSSSSSATAANTVVSNTAENNMPMPMLSIPGVQPGSMISNTAQPPETGSQNSGEKQKLSKEEIESIFAKELKKIPSSDSSYQQRKMMLQKQAERLKQKREENGDRLPMEMVKEKAVQAKNLTMGMAWKLREYALDKMTDPENAESREKAKRIFSNVLVVLICVFIAFLVSSFVTNFVAHPTKVEGESMETTLSDGDTVIIQKLSYYFGSPDRYDVVVFPVYNSETYYIKRVIGLPGETVQIEEGKILINDKELDDDIYGKDEYIDDPGDAGEPITLASDEYFVLGDNRNMSTDSRSSYVGVIKKKNIVGKAWRRVLPYSKAGKIPQ